MLRLSQKLIKGIRRVKGMMVAPHPTQLKRLNFAVTYRCNSRCKMCSIWRKNSDETVLGDQELSLDQMTHLFDGSRYLKSLEEINLTGGEPFLRKDFQNIYRYLRKTYPKTTIIITTNGLSGKHLLIENKEDIFWTILVFSLDGLEETNDFIRGVKGSYRRVREAIDYYKSHYPHLKLGIGFTILPENYHDLRKVYDLSAQLNLSFTMRFACHGETFYGNSDMIFHWTDEALFQVESDVQSIVSEMALSRNILNRLLNPDLFFFSQMVAYQRNKRKFLHCYSGVHSFFLDPYGSVFPCILSNEPIGNVAQESFDDIWGSTAAKERRLSISKGTCHCWTECETIPSLQRGFRHLKYREGLQ